jgi:hypothetical protein
MDTLSLVGDVTKRRKEFFNRAEKLALKAKNLKNLESLLTRDSNSLTSSLSTGDIRREEFFRSLTDQTLTSALAAVYMGSESARPREKLEKAWPIIIGQIIPPLINFISDIEENLNRGDLKVGELVVEDLTPDFARRMSWLGLAARVIRYIVNPTYSFFSVGESLTRAEQGYKQMRRIPTLDDRTCPDCVEYGNLGWQPLGGLPLPGQRCRCYDRCRCRIEYR